MNDETFSFLQDLYAHAEVAEYCDKGDHTIFKHEDGFSLDLQPGHLKLAEGERIYRKASGSDVVTLTNDELREIKKHEWDRGHVCGSSDAQDRQWGIIHGSHNPHEEK